MIYDIRGCGTYCAKEKFSKTFVLANGKSKAI